MKILIIEDEPSLREVMQRALEQERYIVETAATYAEADARIAAYSYDCILLDIMLPDGSGLRLLEHIKHLRRRDNVIIISARDSLDDKVEGLELGADDYLPKPFGMMELVSRVRAILRRTMPEKKQNTYQLGTIHVDIGKHEVTVDGRPVTLTFKEFELLCCLMENEGIVLSRDRLLSKIWGYDFDGETRTVDVHIRTLRQKLGLGGKYIETIRGVGYKMEEIG